MKKLFWLPLALLIPIAFAQVPNIEIPVPAEVPTISPVEEDFKPSTWNTDVRENDDGTVTSKIHLKFSNYVEGNKWEPIDLSLRRTATGFAMTAAPYTLLLPEFADGDIKFVSTNRFSPKTKEIRNDPPVTKIKKWTEATHVRGVQTSEGVLYPNALPYGDILLQPHEQEFRSLVRLNHAPPGTNDLTIPFTEVYSDNLKPESKGKKLTSVITDVGEGFGVALNEFRGISTKKATVWDSTPIHAKSIPIVIQGRYRNGRFEGVKVIPRSFLENATYPVFTDTTSTFFPDPNAETTSVDGDVYRTVALESWDTTHDATNGTAAEPSANPWSVQSYFDGVATYEIDRGFLLFDTSAIPDTDVISAATVQLYITTLLDTDNDAQSYFTIVGNTSPASNTDLVVGDFDQCGAIDNPTKMSDDVDATGISTSAYNTWTMNATGLANISQTGITKWGVRSGNDIEDIAVVGNVRTTILVRSAEQTGTTNDPVLTVTHAAPAAETAPSVQSPIIF